MDDHLRVPTLSMQGLPRSAQRGLSRSLVVGLVLVGGISCGQKEAWRDEYASKEDCLADWGDGTQCEQVASNSATNNTARSSGSGYRYYGPSYSSSSDRIAQQRHYNSSYKSSSPSRASGSVSRGGFGHSASRGGSSGGG